MLIFLLINLYCIYFAQRLLLNDLVCVWGGGDQLSLGLGERERLSFRVVVQGKLK